jgi:drug/metabolite transporter (DMT)-like permease
MSARGNWLAYLALCAGILSLSMSSIFIRWANAPGPVTSFYRMGVAAIILTPFALRKTSFSAIRRQAWIFPVLGGVFTALDHGVWSTALSWTRVANATLMNNTAPIWVALFAWLVLREKLKPSFWVGLVLAMTGATIVLGSDLLQHPTLSRGDGLALLSGIFYAGYFLITQRGREKFATLTYIWMICIVSALVLLGICLGSGFALVGYSTQTVMVFIATGLISQVIGYFSVGYALGHLPASLVAPTMIIQPVLTALLAIPMVGESLQPSQWIGGLIVLAGIYLVNHSHSTSSPTGEQVIPAD